MKQIIRVMTAILIATASFGGLANAQTASCTDTGPGSTCGITINDEQSVTLTCTNNIYQATYNDQNADSGGASSGGNTTGGSVSSGTAVNVNGTTITIGETGCATSVTPGSSTPETPGGGAGAFMPDTLPFTGNSSLLTIIAASLVIAAGVVIASRLALLALRHYTSR